MDITLQCPEDEENALEVITVVVPSMNQFSTALIKSKLVTMLTLCLVIFGCATADISQDFSDITTQIEQRSGTQLPLDASGNIAESQKAQLNKLLSEPLSLDNAVNVALIKNGQLRKQMLQLVSAQGKMIDEMALPNPAVGSFSVHTEGSGSSNPKHSLSYPILDLLFLPRQRRVAQSNYEVEKLAAIQALVDQISSIKKIHVAAVAAKQRADIYQQIQKISINKLKLAQAQFDAGNIPRLELDEAMLESAQHSMSTEEMVLECEILRAELNTALGLTRAELTRWSLPSRLDEQLSLPENFSDEQILSSNLALAIQQTQIEAMASTLGIDSVQDLLGSVELEAESEQDDKTWTHEMGVAQQIPIFNWHKGSRQARRAELEASMVQLRIGKNEIITIADGLTAKINYAFQALNNYTNRLLPLSAKVVDGKQLDYNAMQVGIADVLNAKIEQLKVLTDYVDQLESFWLLHARQLQLHAGGSPK